MKSPLLWHFRFGGPGMERLHLDRFWNEQLAAFDRDGRDNQDPLDRGKLNMPVLAVGGEKSFGPTMAAVMRAAATDVRESVIPDFGHWLMEAQPAATVAAVRAFLDRQR